MLVYKEDNVWNKGGSPFLQTTYSIDPIKTVKGKIKNCVLRELKPPQLLGRRLCCHYANDSDCPSYNQNNLYLTTQNNSDSCALSTELIGLLGTFLSNFKLHNHIHSEGIRKKNSDIVFWLVKLYFRLWTYRTHFHCDSVKLEIIIIFINMWHKTLDKKKQWWPKNHCNI